MNNKKLTSLIIPAYNEEAILESSLDKIFEYLDNVTEVNWEVILINDGSKDNTGEIAEAYRLKKHNLKVIHHAVNMNLGTALKTGFENSKGEYIITYDLDLSYSPEHIGRLLKKLIELNVDMVIASPYMKGGKITNVPFRRLMYSRILNYFFSTTSQQKLHTYTGMVRAYKSEFIKSLNLKAMDYEINPEIIYKAFILRARIVEIPAHLDWSFQKSAGSSRMSGIRVLRGIFSGFMAGYIFRPYIFFMFIGILMFLISMYIIIWIFINIYNIYPHIDVVSNYFDDRFSEAIALVFNSKPHSFLIGGLCVITSIQFISMGFLSLQKKRYFEETFNINTSILREIRKKNNEAKNTTKE